VIQLIEKYPLRATALLLIAITFAAYWPVLSAGYADYDDTDYVLLNRQIHGGLSLSGLKWALGAVQYGTWQPLTWISYMLDVQIHDVKPQGFHLTNLLLHLLNGVLLLYLLHRITGRLGSSAMVAGLFSLHPLHVESVAWIAERKDVLSTCFGLLALLAWVRYTESPGVGRYLLSFAALALGLMAKPMLVTLPLLMLLLDHWPLNRLVNPRFRWAVLLEKLPLLGLAAGSGFMAWFAHHSGGGIRTAAEYPLLQRLPQVVSSYGWYVKKMIWPTDLAVLYPITDVARMKLIDCWPAALFLLLFSAALVLIRFRWGRRFACLETGWCWYLGSLVPVIGLVQFGSHARADRFAYIPLIGLYIIVAWGVPDLAGKLVRTRAGQRMILAIAASLTLLALAAGTRVQAGYWQSSETLFRHALAVTGSNHVAHNSLGKALVERGALDEALVHLNQAVAMRPGVSYYRQNLAVALQRAGQLEAAAAQFREVIRLDPPAVECRLNLGLVLFLRGEQQEALQILRETAALAPADPRAHHSLGIALQQLGQFDESIRSLRQVLALDPGYDQARIPLAMALFEAGRFDEARQEVNRCRVRGLAVDAGLLEKLDAATSEAQP